MKPATIGSRFQVVIPRVVRKKLGLVPMSKVLVQAQGNSVLMTPIPENGWRGIGKDLATEEDPTDYVKRLRREWEK